MARALAQKKASRISDLHRSFSLSAFLVLHPCAEGNITLIDKEKESLKKKV